MKIKATILTLLIPAFYCHGQKRPAVISSQFTAVEKRVDQALKKKVIPSMVIAVSKDGKIIYQEAFGYADVNKKIKATIHTPYQLASATKPFTATAIMMLAERGLINIDSPITKYVPGLVLKKANPHFSTPTVRQVLNHTSGLGTYFDMGYADERYSFDNFDKGWERYGTIFFEPGTVCEYSNLGYGVLARVIAKVSGKTYRDFVSSELLQPLHLQDTYVAIPAHLRKGSAKKYNPDGVEFPEVTNNTEGAGNIYSSVNDLIRFGMFHLGEKNDGRYILSSPLARLMQNYVDKKTLYPIDQDTFYGLGWYNKTEPDSSTTVWHEGGMPGASSMLKLFPKDHIAIAVITNSYDYPFCREIAEDLEKSIFSNRNFSPINEMAGYQYYTNDTTLMGAWKGNITVEGKPIQATLSIDKKEIVFDYADQTLKSFLTENQPLPHKTVLLYGMSNKDYFLGTTTGILPASHLRRELSHLLILKLLRRGKNLTGFATIMAAANREYYAYPFFVDLKKQE